MEDELSVEQAAAVLGVTGRRVRTMLGNGSLPGRHVGRAWLVPAEAVAGIAGRHSGAGRPLAAPRAWGALDMLDGGDARWLTSVARSQIRAQTRRLVGADADTWRAALRGREDRHPVSGHRSVIPHLANRADVWPAGPSTAAQLGADLVVVGAVPEFYLPANVWPKVERQLQLRPAIGDPTAYIRVPRNLWPFDGHGPGRAALAAALLDCGDWRAARAGAEILNELATPALR